MFHLSSDNLQRHTSFSLSVSVWPVSHWPGSKVPTPLPGWWCKYALCMINTSNPNKKKKKKTVFAFESRERSGQSSLCLLTDHDAKTLSAIDSLKWISTSFTTAKSCLGFLFFCIFFPVQINYSTDKWRRDYFRIMMNNFFSNWYFWCFRSSSSPLEKEARIGWLQVSVRNF